MKTRNKLIVDRVVGLPLAWLLNLAARVLGRTWRRDHSITRANVRTIVIAKYVGMGSTLQATPLIRSIRGTFPDARLILVTGRGCRRLAERFEHIDEIITIDDSGLFQVARTSLQTIARLMRRRVDLFFDLELYSAYASIMALVSLARNRFGFYRKSTQHKRGNYTHLMYFNARAPIRHIYLQLGRLAGCEFDDPDRLGRIRVDPVDREEVAAKLPAVAAGPGGYFVINPNASDLLIERRWPTERFAGLIDGLLERYDLPVVLIGTMPDERPYVSELAGRVRGDPGRLLNLAGSLSLGGLFALLEGARCVVTNDTGPMHMAWALGTPTVALFGPVDPGHYGRAAPDFQVVYKPVYCSPCVFETDLPPCRGNNICMQRIGVAEVLERVRAILEAPEAGAAAIPGAPNPGFFLDDDRLALGRYSRREHDQWLQV